MSEAKVSNRAVNWDILRALAMFLVVVVHTAKYLGPIHGFGTATLVSKTAIICDPIFFAMSGFFAIRPSKRSLGNYYLNKVCTILMPLIVYIVLLYFYSTGFSSMSLGNFFQYFASTLSGRWWFIPALVPCLVAAPFLAKGLEALTDHQVKMLAIVMAALFLSGAALTTAQWLFSTIGIETLANLCSLLLWLVPPSVLTSSPAYVLFFILGGLFRRLASLISRKNGTRIIVWGIVFWVADITWATLGISRSDPSYFWLFSTFGIMLLFDRVNIGSDIASRAISWVAQRSYSIYLLQYTTIAISAALFYDQAFFGVIPEMAAPLRILGWIAMTFSAYLLALAIASIVDTLILSPLQKLFRKLFMS